MEKALEVMKKQQAYLTRAVKNLEDLLRLENGPKVEYRLPLDELESYVEGKDIVFIKELRSMFFKGASVLHDTELERRVLALGWVKGRYRYNGIQGRGYKRPTDEEVYID